MPTKNLYAIKIGKHYVQLRIASKPPTKHPTEAIYPIKKKVGRVVRVQAPIGEEWIYKYETKEVPFKLKLVDWRGGRSIGVYNATKFFSLCNMEIPTHGKNMVELLYSANIMLQIPEPLASKLIDVKIRKKLLP
jgi:hypothetical protein